MKSLFEPPEVMEVLRRKWNGPLAGPYWNMYVRDLLNGGAENHYIACFVALVQGDCMNGPVSDYIIDVELINTCRDIADHIRWERDVVRPVCSRLRLWGVPYTMGTTDKGNVFIQYAFRDQQKGGDAICGTTSAGDN